MSEEKNKEVEDLTMALGLGIEVDCFLDNQPRTLYPVTLKDYPDFVSYLKNINPESISYSFFSDNGEGLRNLIALSFGAEVVDDILENINAGNFKKFMGEIFKANGIILEKDDTDSDKKK